MATPLLKLLLSSTLLLALVSAAPQDASETISTPTTAANSDAALNTAPWATVGEDGRPSTVTPVLTTINGVATVISAAPNDLTATVVTRTSGGKLLTDTNTAPIATATNKSGAGSFPICNNKDGEFAPFCTVAGGQPLIVGQTYYITWDPTFYSANSTVEITGNYINETSGQVETQAFSSGQIESIWSFYAWTADSAVLNGASNVTIALTIAAVSPGSDTPSLSDGPRIVVKTPDGPAPRPEPEVSNLALLVALPVSLGVFCLLVCGVCLWNRKTRKIEIKNIMGRGRKGYGISRSKMQRMLGSSKGGRHGEAIMLMDRNGEVVYQDDPHGPGSSARPRTGTNRPSEDLGSLAGSPGKKEFNFSLGQGAGRNAFREELQRQARDKLA